MTIVAMSWGCAGEVELDETTQPETAMEWELPATSEVSPGPAGDPELCMPAFMVPGDDYSFSASGLNPGEQVAFYQGRPGPGPCPPQFGGLCLDMRDIILLRSVVADFDGVATMLGTLPDITPVGAPFFVQAVVARGPGGVDSAKSEVVRARVFADYSLPGNCRARNVCFEEDSDGDGQQDLCDLCPDDAPNDSDRDGVCDSDDICPGGNDAADFDGDGVPNACDPCVADNPDDTDGDGRCDSDDLCPGSDDSIDGDGDGVPDGCDACPADNPDDSDADGVCDTDDVCAGHDDAIDSDGDGIPDGCDLDCVPQDYYVDNDNDGIGAGPAVSLCPEDVPEGCLSLPYVELVGEGDVEVPTTCEPGDYDCQAKAVCEFVSGVECVFQDFDCFFGDASTVGDSYYPSDSPGGLNINFAVGYDFDGGAIVEEGDPYGGYGNICCLDTSFCDLYDIRQDHTYAGAGHYGLDADGIGSLSGDDCADRPFYVTVDGDACDNDPDNDADGDGVCGDVDVCPGGDDTLDADADGTPDACDACPDDPLNGCCTSQPYVELVTGDTPVPTLCDPGDYHCQAKAVCEFVSGVECLFQDFDCYFGDASTVGDSYYPSDSPGGLLINFAVGYDFDGSTIVEEGGAYGGYGNICCLDTSFCDLYGIRQDHTYAGAGHWGLDADGVECLDTGDVPATCNDILLDDPSAPSGTYTIDPDGDGPIESLDVYCDMVSNGGGWTMCGKFDRDNASGQSSLLPGFARSVANDGDLADITTFSGHSAHHDCRALIDAGATEILSAGTDSSAGPPWEFARINNIMAETIADPTNLWDIVVDEDGVCSCTSDAITTKDTSGVDLGNTDGTASLLDRAMCLGDGGMWSNNNVREGAHFGNGATGDCTGSGQDTVFWAWEGSAGDLDSHDCGPHIVDAPVVGTGCNQAGGWEFPATYRYNLMFFR